MFRTFPPSRSDAFPIGSKLHLCRTLCALLLVALLSAASVSAATVPSTDGLYATFKTSRGDFVAALDHDKVPMTVANFVGLAEGTRSWIDFKTGAAARRPFYNGIVFHRVINGFMIQGGSPNGQGTDGPGYQFADEFYPNLKHNAAGILSMANSGPNSNGSQFFITLGPQTHLDYKHAVFGRIVDGMNVVATIGTFETPLPSSSLTVIQSVEITRRGAAATAFDPAAWALPEVKAVPTRLVQKPDGFALRFDRQAFSDYYPFHSRQLTQWTQLNRFSFLHTPTQADFDVSATAAGQLRGFYRVTRADYTPVPASVVGRSISLHLSGGNQTLRLDITAPPRATTDYNSPLGTYVLDDSPPQKVGAYLWDPVLNRGAIRAVLDGIGLVNFSLKFRTQDEGSFTGNQTDLSTGPFPLHGNFTIGNAAP